MRAPGGALAAAALCAAALLARTPALASRDLASSWTGAWTWDICHEDRKPDHQVETFCREGRDRILVTELGTGRLDLTLCPADPWNEKGTQLDDGGHLLTFRSREGYEIRLRLGEDRDHFSGRFISRDGHFGRILGRRVEGCRS